MKYKVGDKIKIVKATAMTEMVSMWIAEMDIFGKSVLLQSANC